MKIYPVFIPHAGCPHRCLFCAQERTTGLSSVPAPAEAEAWLDAVLPASGDGEIAFYGGTFTLLSEPLQAAYLAAAGRQVARGRVSGIRVSTRPDALGAESVARLVSAGVTTVEIGCQSFSPRVLAASRRGHTPDEISPAVQRCRSAGFLVGLQLLPGLPEGDAAEALLSLRRTLDLAPDFLRIYPAVVLAGSGLEELWRRGAYLPWSLDAAVEACADMLRECQLAGVPVIRLGLQQDELLQASVLAGPHHPAFGQLVRSRLWRRALATAGTCCWVSAGDYGDAVGHHRENHAWLSRSNPSFSLQTDADLPRGLLRTPQKVAPMIELASGGKRDI